VRVVRLRGLGLAVCLGLAASCGLAQDWSVGAAWGGVNDIERPFKLEGFHSRDISAWVDYHLEQHVLLRVSYVSIKTTGDNAGKLASGPNLLLPDLRVGMDAATVGVSYTVFEGFYTSGLFAGIGGYRIRPEKVALEFQDYTDAPETALGFHVGVDGDFRIAKPVSLILRLTFHGILSQSKRSLLVAAAGISIHP
jgi:hypothetical protein